MGVQARRLPGLKRWTASNRYNLSFLATGTPRPHQWLLMGVQACRCQAFNASKASNRYNFAKASRNAQPRRHNLPPSHINAQRPTVQAKATPRPDPSLLLGGPACRSPGVRSQQAPQGYINGFLWASKPETLKTFKTLQMRLGTPNRATPKLNQCATPNRTGKSYPKARSIASSGRSSLPFARRSQPTGTPRPHEWLLMGVQACRLPAPKPLKPLKPQQKP